MDIDSINHQLAGTGISVTEIYEHSKASEAYVSILITGENDDVVWEGAVPFQYRRTGIFKETETEISEYLRSIQQYFDKDKIRTWVDDERSYWDSHFARARVTREFFDKLLTMSWVSGDEFPENNNPQRRIQDIKDKGYTIASREGGSERLLLPLPRTLGLQYETIPSRLRSRILKILDNTDAYELGSAKRVGLLPDHKFPEIRWDADTPIDNREDMSEEDIRAKFQLIDNRRNQQKREVCRTCFQTETRGTLFGINFFYEGSERWDDNIPKTGIGAERGCVGCGWYDIEVWRESLNRFIQATV